MVKEKPKELFNPCTYLKHYSSYISCFNSSSFMVLEGTE